MATPSQRSLEDSRRCLATWNLRRMDPGSAADARSVAAGVTFATMIPPSAQRPERIYAPLLTQLPEQLVMHFGFRYNPDPWWSVTGTPYNVHRAAFESAEDAQLPSRGTPQ